MKTVKQTDKKMSQVKVEWKSIVAKRGMPFGRAATSKETPRCRTKKTKKKRNKKGEKRKLFQKLQILFCFSLSFNVIYMK